MTLDRRGQGVLYEITKCPTCSRNVKVSLVDGEIYSHQIADWSIEVCEYTGTRLKQFALGIQIERPKTEAPETSPLNIKKPTHDETSNSIKPIYIGKHHQ